MLAPLEGRGKIVFSALDVMVDHCEKFGKWESISL